MAPLDRSHFSSSWTGDGSSPVPYTPLAAEADDPSTSDNSDVPSPSYTADAKTVPRGNPLDVDGTPRTRLEAELDSVRTENASLRDEIVNLKDHELERLRTALKTEREDRECTKNFLLFVVVIAAFILVGTALSRFT
ncbi:hypothetical protein JCM11491_005914 [Sporobolomyces phaffii]